MEMRTRLGLLVAALTCVAAAPAAAQAKLPAGVTPAMITKGQAIYKGAGLCFACHGQDGKGMVGPNLTDQVWVHGKGTYPEIVQLVTTGIPVDQAKLGKGAMPAQGRIADQRRRREGSFRVRVVAQQPHLSMADCTRAGARTGSRSVLPAPQAKVGVTRSGCPGQ